MIARYRFDGNDELCLRFGADDAPKLLILPPLFDEANRVRHLMVETGRALAELGIASLLPDLPGCNESVVPLEHASISLWQAALIACCEQLGPVTHIASLRGGALIDDALGDMPRWRLAPAKGGQLLRTMLRTRIASDRESGIISTSEALMERARTSGIELAGNSLSPCMIRELDSAAPSDGSAIRLVRFADDPLDADGRIAGAPLWLRAEPAHDPAMAQAMAADIAAWMRG
ncbi:hypothetical protein [Blastomonas sp.]|uniref:hypothetical protein n=1 Tax=Blastomonas sp. TaxID=1909299 RepID=UPI0026239890|nr:hypothetical protein [Blastomonas sp.]MDM7954996.1 hypothetical protein [Blastomonas sp.]